MEVTMLRDTMFSDIRPVMFLATLSVLVGCATRIDQPTQPYQLQGQTQVPPGYYGCMIKRRSPYIPLAYHLKDVPACTDEIGLSKDATGTEAEAAPEWCRVYTEGWCCWAHDNSGSSYTPTSVVDCWPSKEAFVEEQEEAGSV